MHYNKGKIMKECEKQVNFGKTGNFGKWKYYCRLACLIIEYALVLVIVVELITFSRDYN